MSERPLLYRLDGHTPVPVSLMDWHLVIKDEKRVVGRTEVAGRTVSTVFLGIDHNHLGKGPPLLFETAIFGGSDGVDIADRYSTWEEAEAGHRAIVEKLSLTTESKEPQ